MCVCVCVDLDGVTQRLQQCGTASHEPRLQRQKGWTVHFDCKYRLSLVVSPRILFLDDTSLSHWDLKKVKMRQYASFMGHFYLPLTIFKAILSPS